MTKTTEEIEKFAELVRFRMELEEQQKKKDAERLTRRVRKMADETGIDHPILADSLYTFEEIEIDLERRTAEGEYATNTESAQLAIMRSQVRASLLLAAQVKRIADLLEEKNEEDASNRAQDFMTELYKVK